MDLKIFCIVIANIAILTILSIGAAIALGVMTI